MANPTLNTLKYKCKNDEKNIVDNNEASTHQLYLYLIHGSSFYIKPPVTLIYNCDEINYKEIGSYLDSGYLVEETYES